MQKHIRTPSVLFIFLLVITSLLIPGCSSDEDNGNANLSSALKQLIEAYERGEVEEFADKSDIELIDDSVLVELKCEEGKAEAVSEILEEAGAKEVHMRISCPPTRFACFYGIDFPTRTELLAAEHSVDEIRSFLEADSLGYLSVKAMLSCMSNPPEHYCTACWSGDYPVSVDANTHKFVLERHRP